MDDRMSQGKSFGRDDILVLNDGTLDRPSGAWWRWWFV